MEFYVFLSTQQNLYIIFYLSNNHYRHYKCLKQKSIKSSLLFSNFFIIFHARLGDKCLIPRYVGIIVAPPNLISSPSLAFSIDQSKIVITLLPLLATL